MTHVYRIRRWGSPYFGLPCCLLVPRSRNGNIAIRFADGHVMVTTINGIRKLRD